MLINAVIILEIYCPALEAPFRGHISPASCTDDRANIKRNTVCTYGCETGHYVTGGDQSVTCQIDGLWNGAVPYCKRRYHNCAACSNTLLFFYFVSYLSEYRLRLFLILSPSLRYITPLMLFK